MSDTKDTIYVCSTKDDLLTFGYSRENEGTEVVFGDDIFYLQRAGIKLRPNSMFLYGNQSMIPIPQNPIFTLRRNSCIFTITDID